MASKQMCRPTCEASYSETEKLQFSSGSQDCYLSENKHQENKSSCYSMSHAENHNMGSLLHKQPSHNHGAQGCYSSEYKHHEHNSAGYPMNQAGHHNMGLGGMMHQHPSHNQGAQGCYSSEHKHHEHNSTENSMNHAGHYNMGQGGMLYQHPSHNSHSTGHHGFTEKITGCFHNGTTHGHKPTHHGSHNASYGCTEKMEENISCNSGHRKSKLHIKKSSSYKGACEDSSDSESEDEGCNKRC